MAGRYLGRYVSRAVQPARSMAHKAVAHVERTAAKVARRVASAHVAAVRAAYRHPVLGRHGPIFGTRSVLNHNRYFRVGWIDRQQHHEFRIAIGNQQARIGRWPIHIHISIFRAPWGPRRRR